MIKILIADEYIIIRESLKQVLLDSGDMVVVDEAGNSGEMLKKLNFWPKGTMLSAGPLIWMQRGWRRMRLSG